MDKMRFVKLCTPTLLRYTPNVKEENDYTKRKKVLYVEIWDIGITRYIVKWKRVQY